MGFALLGFAVSARSGFAQGSGFAGFGAQALPGSVRVRFGLKKRGEICGAIVAAWRQVPTLGGASIFRPLNACKEYA